MRFHITSALPNSIVMHVNNRASQGIWWLSFFMTHALLNLTKITSHTSFQPKLSSHLLTFADTIHAVLCPLLIDTPA